MKKIIVNRLVLPLLLAACIQQTPAQTNSRNGLVYEQPVLLTKTMMEQHAQLVQWLLNIQYTPQQKEKHFLLIKQYWQNNDYNGITAVQSNLQFAGEIAAKPAAEQKALCRQLRSSLIASLVEDAEKAEDSRWYLQNYLAAWPPLVPGKYPLTKETADDLIDFETFKNKEMKNLAVKPVTAAQRDSAHQQLAAAWQQITDEQKKQILPGAGRLAIIQYQWRKASPVTRVELKKQFVGDRYLTAAEKQLWQQATQQLQAEAGQLHSQQWGLIQNELNYMKQSTDIIMGRGIRWDPSRNRYVQDGGIVTEYW